MNLEKFMLLVFIYVLLNIILYFVYKFTYKAKAVHRIVSTLDNLIFVGLIGYRLFRIQPEFIILIPCILLILYPIAWGLNKELSEDDLASLVILKSMVPIKKENRDKLKIGFVHLVTFPFFYVVDSWKK